MAAMHEKLTEKDLDLEAMRNAAQARDGDIFPSRSFTGLVLKPAYDEAKTNLLEYMSRVNRAHLVMLFEQGIVTDADAAAIRAALEALPEERLSGGVYTGKYEDLFFEVEDWLLKRAGDPAGNLHIARSRNDMGVALYRMALRDRLLELIRAAVSLETAFTAFGSAHAKTAMVAHTHTQQAQPTTLGHYVLGAVSMLGRDIRRLRSAYDCVNRSPMGAAAITTSGFPVDRGRVCGLLGFEEVIENSYDSIGGGDYLGETAAAVMLACVDLGRFVSDLLLWSTQEFGYLKAAAPYVQISSIMPQKRNPVSIEHMRSLLSSAYGDCASILTMLHNTPYGDIVDTEDDAQPCLWRAVFKLDGIYRLLENVIVTVQVDAERMEKRVGESFAVVTELADTLVREEQIPFRKAHEVAHKLVKLCLERNTPLSAVDFGLVSEMFKSVTGRALSAAPEIIAAALDYRNFIAVRRTRGGPEERELLRSIRESALVSINEDIGWEKQKSDFLSESERELEAAFEALPTNITPEKNDGKL